MAICGCNAFGARFPFAVAFVVLIAIYYLLLKKWGERGPRLWVTLALTVTCVPLLLHARQCRYYILAPLLTLLVIDAYLDLLEHPKFRHEFLLILWTTLLLNSFFPAAVLLGVALVIDLIRKQPDRDALKMMGIAAAVILIINLPMAWFCRIWDRRFGGESGELNLVAGGTYLLRYLLTVNNFFLPFTLLIVACGVKWRSVCKNAFKHELSFLFLILCLTQLVGFSVLSDYPFTRYLIGIAPFLMYASAACIEAVAFNRQWLIWTIASVVVATNLLQILPLPVLRQTKLQASRWSRAGIDLHFVDPQNVRSSFARGEIKELINIRAGFPLADYARSMIHPPAGPIDEIVEFLHENAAPGERVKITYGDLPLKFHTDLAITGSVEEGPPAPEWIISRYWRPLRTDDEFFRQTSHYRYLSTTIQFPDLQWNNQPDPLYHYYDRPSDELAPPITILKRAK